MTISKLRWPCLIIFLVSGMVIQLLSSCLCNSLCLISYIITFSFMVSLLLSFNAAEPIQELALKVFQHYYAELCEALSSDPHQIAREMFSAMLISQQTRTQVLMMRGLTRGLTSCKWQADILIDAIGAKIATENSFEPLLVFCKVMKKYPAVKSIAARLKARIGEKVW